MTLEDFNSTSFHINMSCIYNENHYHITAVDFTDGLIGIDLFGTGTIVWTHHENIEILNHKEV